MLKPDPNNGNALYPYAEAMRLRAAGFDISPTNIQSNDPAIREADERKRMLEFDAKDSLRRRSESARKFAVSPADVEIVQRLALGLPVDRGLIPDPNAGNVKYSASERDNLINLGYNIRPEDVIRPEGQTVASGGSVIRALYDSGTHPQNAYTLDVTVEAKNDGASLLSKPRAMAPVAAIGIASVAPTACAAHGGEPIALMVVVACVVIVSLYRRWSPL